MQIIRYINQVVAFLLELAMFAAIGYWGYHFEIPQPMNL